MYAGEKGKPYAAWPGKWPDRMAKRCQEIIGELEEPEVYRIYAEATPVSLSHTLYVDYHVDTLLYTTTKCGCIMIVLSEAAKSVSACDTFGVRLRLIDHVARGIFYCMLQVVSDAPMKQYAGMYKDFCYETTGDCGEGGGAMNQKKKKKGKEKKEKKKKKKSSKKKGKGKPAKDDLR
jgi:hypothetical protein